MGRELEKRIDEAMDAGEWAHARQLLRGELRKDPHSHWCLTELATTYYEQRRYAIALRWSRRAQREAPDCRLVQWDLAGTLDMLGQSQEAIKLYRNLATTRVESTEGIECWESLGWSERLINDSRYRLGLCYIDIGMAILGARWLRAHIKQREAGVRSIYSLRDARQALHKTEQKRSFMQDA